jgi:hypothetical protein
MNSKNVKPKTHFALDVALFTLYLSVVCSAFMAHVALPRNSHLRFMFHALHEVSGIVMTIIIGLHLTLHLPWIRSQLKKLFQSSQPKQTTTISAQPSNK